MNDASPTVTTAAKPFPCSSCGARLEFSPGAAAMKCPYCGQENRLAQPVALVQELDFYEYFARASEHGESEEKQTVTCSSCKAVSTVDKNISMNKCPFCGSQMSAQAKASRLIKPGALLPFKVTRAKAAEEFRRWLSGLWFAPGELKNYASTSGGIKGMYIPYWTYDSRVTTEYEGQRGEDYYETEQYETEDSNGNTVVRTRQVTRTRWYPASGVVGNAFDDVLVLAGRSLPAEIIASLEPWDLKNLVPYSDEYMSGFQAEAYQVDLGTGFEKAKAIMDGAVRRSIERDIGGNHQQISAARSQYDDISFKHILLPMWISAYRYRDKTFRFIVNARTGQVQGERPWSVFKIALATVALLVVLLIIAILAKR
jgi:LSD1 subclass zinc finger protein